MNKILSVLLSIIISFLGIISGGYFSDLINQKFEAATPVANNVTSMPEYEGVDKADIYVSPNGSDENDGSLNAPFLTIEKAKEAVKKIDKTGKNEIIVALMSGDYRVKGITFTAEDSGTENCPIRYCKYGDGEVTINGGVSLSAEDFENVKDESVLNRLSGDAKEKVLCVDLSKYGITKNDYGKIYTIGQFNTAHKYDGDWTGPIYSEVFFNDVRMDLAQFPDKGDDYLYTEEVVKVGYGSESDAYTKNEDWDIIRNPESDVYRVNQTLADRINSWKTLDDVWMFGWFMYDWADASSPVGSFNYAERTLSPKFVSMYGAKVGAPYYFYNVFEELSAPGEFYLDRENAMLYIYPTEDMSNAKIDMSLITDSIITIKNADYISFEGISFKGTRGDAFRITGNSNKITHCVIKNIGLFAAIVRGYNNVFDYNEITRTGRGGIDVTGGDVKTLTPGNNRIENNLIHDWSEIYKTYSPAVRLNGVGDICAHNEMYNSPNMAIWFGGNNNVVEYNIIHNVCLLTNDGGAIYSGRRWDWYGNVIRYNYIYDLGSTVKNGDEEITYTPDGIYLDDNLAGQTVYGNILVNVPKYGLHLGSGRDNNVYNNIIINSKVAVSFDNRARKGLLEGAPFPHCFKGNVMYTELMASPWQTEVWQEAFPQYKYIVLDYDNPDNPNNAFNPTDSRVCDNLIICQGEKSIGNIDENVLPFITVENNFITYKYDMFKYFTAPDNGDYSIKDIEEIQKYINGFENIPIEEMGIEK